MLGKLTKHEIALTAKKLLPMYLIFFVITILARITMTIEENTGIFTGDAQTMVLSLVMLLLLFLYIIMLIALGLMTYFVILKRFYKNLLGDEGYLMFSLPVKTGHLILSKLITAFLWLTLLAPSMVLSFLILFWNSGISTDLSDVSSMFTEEITLTGMQIGLIIGGLILFSILETIRTILSCYLSMTLGQHLWHEHRLFGSILFYLGIGAISSVFVNISNTLTDNIILSVQSLASVNDVILYYSSYLPGLIVVNLLLTILLYFFNHYLLDKKLNLN